MKTKLVLLVGLFILAGCASNGTERKPSKPMGFISYEEIQTITGATTARDIVSCPDLFGSEARVSTPKYI